MKIREIKSCLRQLLKNVFIYKEEDSNPLLQQAEDNLKAKKLSETSTEEEIDLLEEQFDSISDDWFNAFNSIEKYSEKLFDEFAVLNGDKVKLNRNRLWKALDLLPSSEAKHALILGIKYYGLSKPSMYNLKRYNIKKIITAENDQTFEELAKKALKSEVPPKFSRENFIRKQEETTLNELYKLSKVLNPRTLIP